MLSQLARIVTATTVELGICLGQNLMIGTRQARNCWLIVPLKHDISDSCRNAATGIGQNIIGHNRLLHVYVISDLATRLRSQNLIFCVCSRNYAVMGAQGLVSQNLNGVGWWLYILGWFAL